MAGAYRAGDRVQIIGSHPWSGHAGTVERIDAVGTVVVMLDCHLRAPVADPKYLLTPTPDTETGDE